MQPIDIQIQSRVFSESEREYTLHLKLQNLNLGVTDEELLQQRAPLDLLCIVDRSGSMSGSGIRLVKETLDFILSNLQENDCFSLISYANDVTVDFGLNNMTRVNLASASRICESLTAGGHTNLSDGIYGGIRELIERQRIGSIQSILLMTDGQATTGDLLPDVICANIKQLLADVKCPVTIHTFGYGGDHNEELLSKISQEGNGMYYYIENSDSIGKAYANCLGGIMTTVIQNPSIIINLPTMTFCQVYGDVIVENVSPTSIKITTRELQKGEQKDFILLFRTSVDIQDRDIDINFQGDDVMNQNETRFETHPVAGDNNQKFDYYCQFLRIETYTSLFAALDSRIDAKRIITELASKITQSPIHPSEYTDTLVNELNTYLSLIDMGDQNVWKKIVQAAMAHKFQRSVDVDESSTQKKYNTNGKVAMVNRFVNREQLAKCHNCGEKGHFAKNCNREVLCSVCHQPGHLQSSCPHTQCYNCRQLGHKALDCPLSTTSTSIISGTRSSSEACFNCGKQGHKKRDCPERGNRGGNRGRRGKRGRRN